MEFLFKFFLKPMTLSRPLLQLFATFPFPKDKIQLSNLAFLAEMLCFNWLYRFHF